MPGHAAADINDIDLIATDDKAAHIKSAASSSEGKAAT